MLAASPAFAQRALGVGFYAPGIPLNPIQRFGLAKKLAAHLTRALGTPVQGFAYKSAEDFARDVKKKKIHFAVVDGVSLAGLKVSRVLAAASVASPNWTLMAKQAANLLSLKGQTLQLPSVGGHGVGLVEHGLLGSNIEVNKTFRVVTSPDVGSAMRAVKLGQARLAFGPIDSPGLTQVLNHSIAVPPPAFVLLSSVSSSMVSKATKSIASFNAPPLTGWKAGGMSAYTRLAAQAHERKLRMVMVASNSPQLPRAMVGEHDLDYEYPPVDYDLYVAP